MSKVAFVGFGEVNTPIDIIIRKCENAAAELEKAGIMAKSIGYLTDTKDRVVYNEEERRFLEPFRKEESHKII